MARYIDADKLKEAFHTDTEHLQSRDEHLFDLIMFEIDEQPTADVKEVKRGHWYNITSDVGRELVGSCSVCGKEYNLFYGEDRIDFCPYCSADMRGDTDGNL